MRKQDLAAFRQAQATFQTSLLWPDHDNHLHVMIGESSASKNLRHLCDRAKTGELIRSMIDSGTKNGKSVVIWFNDLELAKQINAGYKDSQHHHLHFSVSKA